MKEIETPGQGCACTDLRPNFKIKKFKYLNYKKRSLAPRIIKKMSNCVFCKVIQGEIPCDKVYEDDEVLAFLDINPINKGHCLVIPKEHYDNLLEMPEELAQQIIRVVKKVAPSVMEATQADGFNLGVNSGSAAGQIVFHAHFHVIPRHSDDGLEHWPHKKYESDEEKEAIGKNIADLIYENSREGH